MHPAPWYGAGASNHAPPVQPPSKGRDVIKDPNIQLATAEQPAASDHVDGTSDLNADFDERVSSAQPLGDRNAAAAQHAIAFQPNVKVGLQLAREVKSKRPDLYGEPDVVPIPETTLQQPINPYGFTKLVVEQALADYAAAYGFAYAALRYFNAAGATGSTSVNITGNASDKFSILCIHEQVAGANLYNTGIA